MRVDIRPSKRREEAEGSRQVAFGFGRDLVQAPQGEAALRQMRIKRGQAEGQGALAGRAPSIRGSRRRSSSTTSACFRYCMFRC